MKIKFSLLLVLTILISASVCAQEPQKVDETTPKIQQAFKKHDISISYGRASTVGVMYAGNYLLEKFNFKFDNAFAQAIDSIYGTDITGLIEYSMPKLTNYKAIGAINVGYSHHFTKIIAADAVLSYTFGKLKYSAKDENGVYNEIGYANSSCFTALIGVKFDWINHPNFGLYSRLLAGATYVHYKGYSTVETIFASLDDVKCYDILFNGQISPLGFEGGNESFRGYVEIGIGQCGMFQVGFRYKFD